LPLSLKIRRLQPKAEEPSEEQAEEPMAPQPPVPPLTAEIEEKN
jgi:hypothetical protein